MTTQCCGVGQASAKKFEMEVGIMSSGVEEIRLRGTIGEYIIIRLSLFLEGLFGRVSEPLLQLLYIMVLTTPPLYRTCLQHSHHISSPMAPKDNSSFTSPSSHIFTLRKGKPICTMASRSDKADGGRSRQNKH